MSQEGRVGEFVKAGGIALGDMIKESAFQKLSFAQGIAKKQKNLRGRDFVEFVRKIMQTNLAAEISDRFCELGDSTYQGIFSERKFDDSDIQKAIDSCREEVTKYEPAKKSPTVKSDTPKPSKRSR
jgi:hypothetical protein